MTTPFTVTKAAVRHFLLMKQGLMSDQTSASPKGRGLPNALAALRQLECIQIDPVAAVARNQHLVLAARVPRYQPEQLDALLLERQVFEYWANAACVIPIENYPLFEPIRRQIVELRQPQLEEYKPVVKAVLNRLEAEGPLPSKAFMAAERVHGFWDNKEPKTKVTSHVLNLLHDTGRIHVVGRIGTTRLFDVRERAIPDDLLKQAANMTDAEARQALTMKYMRAYRVFDPSDARFGWQHMTAAERNETLQEAVKMGQLIPLQIEGVKRVYYILAQDADELGRCQEITRQTSTKRKFDVLFLPPLDNLLWRRDRIEDLFGFSYKWEVYTPEKKRKFGYYAMPILAGDALIGRMDPRLDRASSRLNIRLLQIEPHVKWSKTLRNRILRALEDFAKFHHAVLGNIETDLL